MTDDGLDPALLIGLHKLAAQNGDGLAPELLERLADRQACLAASAEVIALPGLHERPVSRNQHLADGWRPSGPRDTDNVIAFPAPKWQQNAARKKV